MRARLVVFPIKGRNWCFTRCVDSVSASQSSSPPPQWNDLWRKVSSNGVLAKENAGEIADFFSEKMNRAWIGLEKAPKGTWKSKLHSLGEYCLSRVVKPTEILLKSVSDDVKEVEITYPASLNPRLVRRRLRHIAMRESAIHKRNFYGSVAFIPLTSALVVLPLPNVLFFWASFRAYSNWRALKGSERLMLLVSDCPKSWVSLAHAGNGNGNGNESKDDFVLASKPPWVLQPSKDLEALISDKNVEEGLSNCIVSKICQKYNLENKDVLKYKD